MKILNVKIPTVIIASTLSALVASSVPAVATIAAAVSVNKNINVNANINANKNNNTNTNSLDNRNNLSNKNSNTSRNVNANDSFASNNVHVGAARIPVSSAIAAALSSAVSGGTCAVVTSTTGGLSLDVVGISAGSSDVVWDLNCSYLKLAFAYAAAGDMETTVTMIESATQWTRAQDETIEQPKKQKAKMPHLNRRGSEK